MAKRRTNRYAIEGRFERIPGPERRYRELSTGRVVTRYYVEQHAPKVRLTRTELRQRDVRRRSVHDNRVIWFRDHKNYEAWLRGAPPSSYWGKADVEEDQEFINMELLIQAYDPDIRDIGYDYFRELEEEYEYIQWGDSP